MPRTSRGRRAALTVSVLLALFATVGCGNDADAPKPRPPRRPASQVPAPKPPPKPPQEQPPDEVPGDVPAKPPAKPRAQLPANAPSKLKRLCASDDWLPGTPPKNRQGKWELIHEKTSLVFVHVPGGSFEMGSEANSDSLPIRSVKLQPFLLCKTEVSQRAWDRVGGTDDRTSPGLDLPINRIIWNEARVWCRDAGSGLRLPTEAEWEFAARAGGSEWVSGDPASMGDFAWFSDNGDNKLHPVGKKKPNKWGFHDMAGNVAEWCEDIYADYGKAPTDGRAATTGGAMRVLRGGNYSASRAAVASSYRDRSGPGSRYGGPGLRPAVSLR